MTETTRFDPLLPPSEEGLSVFRGYLDRNPLADMRAIPNEWLLKERGRAEVMADRLAQAEALLHRIDQRGYVGDRDHEDIQRLLSGAGPTRDNRRWFGRDGSKWEGE